MSKIKVNSLEGVGASTPAISIDNTSGTCTANITNNLSNRNLLINGAMNVSQRGTPTAASSYTTAGYGACDRWRLRAINTDQAAFVTSQESDAPTGSGFSKSLKIQTNTVETSLDSNEIFHVSQLIEAQNLQHLNNGTSSALPVTLSFWVKAYQVGTYVVNLYKNDNTQRQITATYTISTQNTWEFKTMTFSGDTSGGGIADDTGTGFSLYWILASGSNFTGTTSTSWGNYADGGFANGQTVNIMSSTDNYFYLTGVQLEVDHTGSGKPTDFEHRSYSQELALSQRYFYKIIGTSDDMAGIGFTQSSSDNYFNMEFPVPMRDYPTLTGSATPARFFSANNGQDFNLNSLSLSSNMTNANPKRVMLYVSQAGTAGGLGGALHFQDQEGFLEFSAEL